MRKQKYNFSVGNRIVNPDFDLTINVIDHLIFGNLSMHEIDLKIYDWNFYDDISCELHASM